MEKLVLQRLVLYINIPSTNHVLVSRKKKDEL